jgi:hypothetical protein
MPTRFAVYLPQSIRQISRVEFDLQNKLGLFEAFEGSYDPGQPPDLTLLLMVARTIYDPVDWVASAVEVFDAFMRGDIQEGLNTAFWGIMPGVSGAVAAGLRRADDVVDSIVPVSLDVQASRAGTGGRFDDFMALAHSNLIAIQNQLLTDIMNGTAPTTSLTTTINIDGEQ